MGQKSTVDEIRKKKTKKKNEWKRVRPSHIAAVHADL